MFRTAGKCPCRSYCISHWLCRKLYLSDPKWNTIYVFLLRKYHHPSAHYPTQRSCNRGQWWRWTHQAFALLHLRRQGPWFPLCATLYDATLGMDGENGFQTKRALGLQRWVCCTIQRGEVYVLCSSISATHQWLPDEVELLWLWPWERLISFNDDSYYIFPISFDFFKFLDVDHCGVC